MIELVDFNEIYGNSIAVAADTTAKKTRRGRTKKVADATDAPATEASAEEVAEPTAE